MISKKLLLILLLLVPLRNFATHLLGGEITYKHISYNSSTNTNTYKIQLNMYRDCQYGLAPLDDSISIGFYENVTGKKSRTAVLTLGVPDSSNVDPFAGKNYSSCKTLPKACMQWGKYIGNIDLPQSKYGYLILYQRCCRKNGIINVLDTQGQSYTNVIPPDITYINSSPYFTDPPAPFLGVNDTASYFNNAIDPDGDSLVYSLARPYLGGTTSAPVVYPLGSYNSPGLIQYQPGYSFSAPFGSKGYASIDPVTGLTTVYATKTGNYAIAIDVKEYRNGVYLGTTRRDVMLYITSVLSSVKIKGDKVGWYTTADSFSVMAGKTLSFSLQFSGGDTLSFSANGEPLDTTRNSYGTFTIKSFPKQVNPTFTWQTKCSDLRTQPYIIKYVVTNKWCPPSIPLKGTKRIYVLPYKGSDTIFGPTKICSSTITRGRYYIQGGSKTNTYIWSVKGGSIKNYSLYNDSIYVDWGKSTSGSIRLTQSNSMGCPGDTINVNVTILPPPSIPVISGKLNVCAHETDSYFVKNYTGSDTLKWEIIGGAILKKANNYAIVKWGTSDSGIVEVQLKNINGCTSDTSKLKVIKNVPKADSIAGAFSVCPNAKGIDYYIYRNIGPGSIFKWFVSGGIIASGNNSSHITVNWGNKGKGKVQAIEYTQYGCVGDTLNFNVSKDYNLSINKINGDTSLCEFSNAKTYSVLYVHNSTYTWNIKGGSFNSGTTSANTNVNWGSAGRVNISVTQTAYDSVNKLTCTSNNVILPVLLNPLPNTGPIIGDQTMCQGFIHQYTVSGLAGSSFQWSFSGGNNNIINQGKDTITLSTMVAGTYTLSVRELTKDSCLGNPVSIALVVLPSPKLSKISGPSIVCSPNLNNITYSVLNDAGSSFQWSILGGNINSVNGSNTININWNKPGMDSLSVKETNSSGCMDSTGIKVEEDSALIKMDLVTTIRQNEQQIEIFWNTKNAQFLRGKLQVMRRGLNDFKEINIDTVGKFRGHYIDKTANPSKNPYFYRLVGTNNCLNTISSDTHKTVFLNGKFTTDSTIYLYWNNYFGWQKNIRNYLVYRSFNTDTSLIYYNAVQDTFLNLKTDINYWRQCFRVAGVNAIDTTLISYSNKICFEFDPLVYVPNVFTPDGNKLNDYFHVYATYAKSFDLSIFDRWGEKIFHSSDPNINWDGTFMGKKCEEGVYIYILNVGGTHSNVSKKGTISLLR